MATNTHAIASIYFKADPGYTTLKNILNILKFKSLIEDLDKNRY
jgi:hypothetical protein